jgi:hypothetical protein
MVVFVLATGAFGVFAGGNQVCWSRSTFFHSACSDSSIRHSAPSCQNLLAHKQWILLQLWHEPEPDVQVRVRLILS